MTDIYMTPKQKRRDKQKIYLPLQNLKFDYIYPNCPIEFLDGYVCYESESYNYYAVLKLQNAGQKNIKNVEVRFLCYQYANIPYEKINFVYSFDRNSFGKRMKKSQEEIRKSIFQKEKPTSYIEYGEIFGEEMYIRLPDSYFKRIELEIRSITYENGEKVKFNHLESHKPKQYNNIDDDKKYAYSRMNIYSALEEEFPITNLPVADEYAWICCCGQKNILSDKKCIKCQRDLEWQLENLNEETFESLIQVERDDPTNNPNYKNYLKAAFKSGMNGYVNREEQERKRQLEEKAMENLKKQIAYEDSKQKQILPRIALYFVVVGLILLILTVINNLK